MPKFIKLTNMLLNVNDISKILIKPNKYYISTVSKHFNGFLWSLSIVGLGNITSHGYEIEICETTQPIDYKIISDWINSN